MSKFDYPDPGMSDDYCNGLSIDIEDERADEARDARDRADEAEATAAKAREFPAWDPTRPFRATGGCHAGR